MADLYEKMTDQDFDRLLTAILQTMTGDELLTIPGIYNILSEHFNNDVLDDWKAEQPEEENDIEFMLNNFINGNLKEARRLADNFPISEIRIALIEDYGYSFVKATLTAEYLTTGENFQAACDAE